MVLIQHSNSDSQKLYAERDREALAEFIFPHLEAMTSENLNGKGDIAAELAWRDAEIDRLAKLVAKLPHTADGVPIVPDAYDGPPVWHPTAGEMNTYWQSDVGTWMAQDDWSFDVGGLDNYARPVSECYSTEAAAAAATVGDTFTVSGPTGQPTTIDTRRPASPASDTPAPAT